MQQPYNIYMKKILIGLIIITFYNCSTTKTTNSLNTEIVYDYSGKVDNEQLIYIQKNYKWETNDILIINFNQPLSSCHYKNNRINKTTKTFYEDFYSKINTDNCSNIFVLSNIEKVKKKIDNKKYFDDKDDFLLKNFFHRKKTCFGVLVIRLDGYYIQYNGHYSKRQVAKFIENLKV